MKYAITGATGRLGRGVVQNLLKTQPAGNIIAIVRDTAKASDLAAQGVQVREAPYEDVAALKAALTGVDKLLLVSGSEFGVRVQQHRNVIDMAGAAGVKHVIYTSGPRATTTTLVFAPDHKATEEYLVDSGLTYTMVRNNWYTENYLPQVETARQTGALVAAVGEGRVASASVADFAAGAAAVLLGSGHENRVYEFSGDYAWNHYELASAIADIIGKPVTYRPVDPATVIGILVGLGLDEGTARVVAALDANIAEGVLSETTGELAALLGRPTTPLREGLQQALSA